MFVSPARLSPATKLVFKVLELNGWMTQKEIVKETYLPSRTVKYAIRNLREKEIIQDRSNPDDLRSKYYGFRGKICTNEKVYNTVIGT